MSDDKIEEFRQDTEFELKMRNDDEFFADHSHYYLVQKVMTEFKRECELYDRDFTDEINSIYDGI